MDPGGKQVKLNIKHKKKHIVLLNCAIAKVLLQLRNPDAFFRRFLSDSLKEIKFCRRGDFMGLKKFTINQFHDLKCFEPHSIYNIFS